MEMYAVGLNRKNTSFINTCSNGKIGADSDSKAELDKQRYDTLKILFDDRVDIRFGSTAPTTKVPEEFIRTAITELDRFKDNLDYEFSDKNLSEVEEKAQHIKKELKNALTKAAKVAKHPELDRQLICFSDDMKSAASSLNNGPKVHLNNCMNDIKRCMVEQKQLMAELSNRELNPSVGGSNPGDIHLKKTPESYRNLMCQLDSSYSFENYKATLNRFENTAALFSSHPTTVQTFLKQREDRHYGDEFNWMKVHAHKKDLDDNGSVDVLWLTRYNSFFQTPKGC